MNNVALSMIRCGNIANDPQFSRQFQHGDGQSFNAEDFDDIFSSIFGQHARQSRQRPATRGHDIEIEVAVFLEETLTEHKRTISYNLPVYNAFGMIEQEIPKTLNVKIPAGVGNGQRIRLKGQGTPGEKWRPEWRFVAGDSYCTTSAV
ncbi:curved DNA-binding protein [Escherichia coli]|nr:curved DNA-binding protein [Escherichia coli]